MKFYDIAPILKTKSKYNMIIGMRSNGKTYGALRHALSEYFKHGSEIAYIRRYREDLRGKRGEQLFAALVLNEEVSKLSDGEWTGIRYYSQRWYLIRQNEKGDEVRSERPFCYGFSLSEMEHDKSISYPLIRTVIYDEFITRQYYLNDEFVLFCNALSTIIRLRDDVTIFMLGNTVNKFCPYFKEMGLKHIESMEPGTIDTYKTVAGLRIAVEYCATTDTKSANRPSDIYFSFDNPKLEMITGGSWELDIYPHLPVKYQPKNIKGIFFICFEGDTLQCEVVELGHNAFIYIHVKTTPIHDYDSDMIYTVADDYRINYYKSLVKARDRRSQIVSMLFKMEKIYYQNNEVGEIVRNYRQVTD